MKRKITLLCASVFFLTCSLFAQNETQSARNPLELYIQAHATGNGDLIKQAFTPDARISSIREGKYAQMSRDEFAARFSGKPAADEEKRQRRIESLDVTGDVAVAKIVLDYPNVKFTDYMTLAKVDGEWKIVNKTYHAEHKRQAQAAK